MKYRDLGKTGVKVSEVGLGTWQLGGSDWGDMSEADALKILHRSVDLGVNFLDSADVYGGGRSESLIGKFLRENRSKVYVATKLGRRGDDGNGWPQNFTLESMRRHTQDSIHRLGVETIFLQQMHCIPTDALREGEIFENFQILKQEGLIQHWGVSVESVEEGLICLEQEECASLQVIFNIFRQKLVTELFPQAKAKKVGILARVPLASGLLSGAFKPGHIFAANDHRSYNCDGQKFNVGETFAGIPFEKGVKFAEQVRQIFNPIDNSDFAQKSLRWILDHDAVSTVIPGASRLSQAQSNAAASDMPFLKPLIHEALEELYVERIASTIRGPY